jgi:hypothetical protein
VFRPRGAALLEHLCIGFVVPIGRRPSAASSPATARAHASPAAVHSSSATARHRAHGALSPRRPSGASALDVLIVPDASERVQSHVRATLAGAPPGEFEAPLHGQGRAARAPCAGTWSWPSAELPDGEGRDRRLRSGHGRHRSPRARASRRRGRGPRPHGHARRRPRPRGAQPAQRRAAAAPPARARRREGGRPRSATRCWGARASSRASSSAWSGCCRTSWSWRGRAPWRGSPSTSAALLDEVTSRFRSRRRQAAGVTLVRRIGENVLAVGDRERLKQVFHNLLVNALEATPRGGVVTVSCHRDADEPDACGDHRRHRAGHPRRDAGEGLRALLHDEGGGHGAGAVHRAADRRAARRSDRPGERRGQAEPG